jgi:hypothetical protein
MSQAEARGRSRDDEDRGAERHAVDHRGAEYAIDIGVGADAAASGYVAWVVVRRRPQMQVLAREEVRAGMRPWRHADEALAAAYARGRRLVFLELSRATPPSSAA